MKAHRNKIKKGIFRSKKEVASQISPPKAAGIDICLIILIGVLPFAATRILFGGTSVGIVSCAIIAYLGIILFTENKFFTSAWKKYRRECLFVFMTLLVLCAIAVVTNTSRGWGILIEWFALPMILGLAILHRRDANPQSNKYIMWGLLVALAGVILSGAIFSLYGVFTFDGRLYALWPSANHLALFSAPLVALTASFLAIRKRLSTTYAVSLGILTFGGLFVLYQTKSFGGLAALCGALILTYFINPGILSEHSQKKKRISIVVACLIFGVLALTSVEKAKSLLENLERSSLASRLTIYEVSVDLLRHSPLTGIGLGNFQQEYLTLQKYYEPYLEWAVPLPHNTVLAFWLYGGIAGLLAILVATAKAFHTYANASLRAKQKMLPFLAALITIIIHGLVDTTFFRADLAVLYCLIVTALVSLGFSQKESAHTISN